MAVLLHVLGAIGAGGPLLAEWLGMGQLPRRVVLCRVRGHVPELPESSVVVPKLGTLETEEGRWWVEPFIDGIDGHDLAAGFPEGVPEAVVVAVLQPVVAALAALAPAVHGRLRRGAIRISADGQVRLVGFVGTRSDLDDVDALAELAGEWLTADGEADLPPGWAVLPVDLAGWTAFLAEREGASLPPVVEDLADTAPLAPHPLAGRRLQVSGAGERRPPKVVLARISALTLVLGLFIGGWLVPAAPAVVEIEFPPGIDVRCGDLAWSGPRVQVPAGLGLCEVSAWVDDKRIAGPPLDTRHPRLYHCRVDHGALECRAS